MKASQYPVLDNKPIDQWKVTELKEELKRRKLITKGLKEDLIKRLDEALRVEREAEAAEEVDNNGVDEPKPETVSEAAKVEGVALGAGEPETVAPVDAEEIPGNDDGKSATILETVSIPADNKDSSKQPSEDKTVEGKEPELFTDKPQEVEKLSAGEVPSAGTGESLLSSETAMSGQAQQDDDKLEKDNGDSMAQQDSEAVKPTHEYVKLETSDPKNQVSEVSTNLGFPVKSNSISTDSVSINEKNEIEDNIIADNVKLEPDVKPEMVQPSSSDLVPDGGESHLKDVEEPHENKVSVEETDNNVTNADLSQKNHSADLGSSEKLNLDRSSGDDSVEEDALESKQIDSNYNSEEMGERTEKNEVPPTTKEDAPLAAMDIDIPAQEKSAHSEIKDAVAASSDKRKLPDQEAVLNSEPSKRQRRWKSESNKVTEPQSSSIPPPAVPKDVPEYGALKRNLSRSDSVVTDDTPKEREVPPSTKPATNSLRIDRFLRPFTLKAVQELLAKTGTVTSFWMDHIKTHCYVTYSTVEEAVETRNAVYNLQWPPNGGRHLLAEFVDPQEVKARVEAPSQPPAAPVSTGPTAPEPPTLPQPSPRQQSLKQQMSQQPTLPPPPPLSNPALARERAHPPPPPPEKVEAPIVTLDDLFRKTKATPRIYYLPLSEEQVKRKTSRL